MSASQSPRNRPGQPPTMPQETDSAREANLHAQRIALLYEALPAALVASIGCALALVIINWNVLPQGPLLIWLAYQLVLSAGRYRLACSFKAGAPAPAAVQDGTGPL